MKHLCLSRLDLPAWWREGDARQRGKTERLVPQHPVGMAWRCRIGAIVQQHGGLTRRALQVTDARLMPLEALVAITMLPRHTGKATNWQVVAVKTDIDLARNWRDYA